MLDATAPIDGETTVVTGLAADSQRRDGRPSALSRTAAL